MEGRMATDDRFSWQSRASGAFQPVSDMLDNGRCEPLKAAVHGVLLATVCLCAAYNSAAWLKRRQRHLAINAIIYISAAWWERCHVVHHLEPCRPVDGVAPVVEDLSDAA
jgi:hypothetical protein